jgi:hypothetical protein
MPPRDYSLDCAAIETERALVVLALHLTEPDGTPPEARLELTPDDAEELAARLIDTAHSAREEHPA